MSATLMTSEQREHLKLQRKQYYQKHQIVICKKTIGEYCYRSIEKVQNTCPEKVLRLVDKYPFDAFAVHQLHRQLWRYRILPSQALYDDCYDAGMLAYLYSIARCAYMGYSNVEAYITKMIRIYVNCALVIYQDSKNLCRENNFKELHIDQLTYRKI
jgi:hypothetical protein